MSHRGRTATPRGSDDDMDRLHPGHAGGAGRRDPGQLVRKYSWARNMGVHVTSVYDQTTADAIAEFQRRVGLPVTGIANFATQVRLGVVELAPPTLTTAYTVPGTWAGWNDGPPAWTAWKLDPQRFRQQGGGFQHRGISAARCAALLCGGHQRGHRRTPAVGASGPQSEGVAGVFDGRRCRRARSAGLACGTSQRNQDGDHFQQPMSPAGAHQIGQ
jgi:Putative peptidoglycan binding domain